MFGFVPYYSVCLIITIVTYAFDRSFNGAGAGPPPVIGPELALHDSGKIYNLPILTGSLSEIIRKSYFCRL